MSVHYFGVRERDWPGFTMHRSQRVDSYMFQLRHRQRTTGSPCLLIGDVNAGILQRLALTTRPSRRLRASLTSPSHEKPCGQISGFCRRSFYASFFFPLVMGLVCKWPKALCQVVERLLGDMNIQASIWYGCNWYPESGYCLLINILQEIDLLPRHLRS